MRTFATAITDNAILDDYQIPFGEWVREIVFWITSHLGWLLSAIEWPFSSLLQLVRDDIGRSVPWFVVVLFFVALGTLTRNLRVGLFAGAALTVCGLLGTDFWRPTVDTIAMIVVAVFFSCLVGIPLGIMCGRLNGAWNVVRPVLDAMQVVHPFVYLLPVIFFWSTGPTSGVMVTMIFATPPIVRLTNLGIRQVPPDVVDAARAYGAPEFRVLTDVQLPLARPAIMTGLNQTLLMALSMVGIIALIAGGGLGQLILNGVGNLRIPLAASSGLALYIVGVVLDRISQPEGANSGGLLRRIRHAWAHRADPEAALAAAQPQEAPTVDDFTGSPVAVRDRERLGGIVTLLGAGVMLLGVISPWATGAGAVSSFPRADDGNLPGQSFAGLAAEGGSWFGVFTFAAACFLLASAAGATLRRASWPRALGPDYAMVAALVAMACTAAFLAMAPSPFADGYSVGAGAWISFTGSLLATVGAAVWLWSAPYRPWNQVKPGARWGRLLGAVVACAVLIGASFGSWVFDERTDTVLTPDQQEELERLRELGTAEAAIEITAITSSAQRQGTRVHSGFADGGPRIGWILVALGASGIVLALASLRPSSTRAGRSWGLDTVTVGVGAGAAAIALAWIISILRVAPPNYYSGAGSFIALVGGAVLVSTVGKSLANHRRQLEWTAAAPDLGGDETRQPTAAPELAGQTA